MQSLHLNLLRKFLLPVELRFMISVYFIARLTNITIRTAVMEYYDGRFGNFRQRKKNRRNLTLTYGYIAWWDTSLVTDTSQLFRTLEDFDENISNWDVSNVTTMEHMFSYYTKFNQPIGKWNVSNVTNMKHMFYKSNKFNQPLHEWNVSKVEYNDFIFWEAQRFNHPPPSWNFSILKRF